MPKKTVCAVRNEDGHLELLEAVDIPEGTKLTVTLELPDEHRGADEAPALPVRNLGPIRGPINREDVYDEVL